MVHEYVSGGGWAGCELPKALVTEALLILRAVLADFKAWGGAHIITTCDHRLGDISLPADSVISLNPADYYNTLELAAKRCTAALIIAPENDNILKNLSALMESHGVRLLGSSSESIGIASNKWICHKLFQQAGLATPATWLVNVMAAEATAQKIGYPLVMKPLDGIGCEGVSLARNSSSLLLGLRKYKYTKDTLLLQRYIEGQSISASLMIGENDSRCMSLNKQTIEVDTSFHYLGCEVPYICDRHAEAVSLAKHAAALIPGLKGYVGVDLLVGDKGCQLIEINPRLTTSYAGLQKVSDINMAESIWRASLEERLPQEYILAGKAIINLEDSI